MARNIESRLIDMKAELYKAMENGSLTVYSTRRFDGGPGGPLVWAAALALVQSGKVIRLEYRQKRITMGPRPHTKFRNEMVIARASQDAI